jgi:hypothetical protein
MAIRRRYADVWPFVAVTVTQYECTLDALVATKTERPDALFVAVVFNRNQPQSTALQNKSIIHLTFSWSTATLAYACISLRSDTFAYAWSTATLAAPLPMILGGWSKTD